MKPNQNKTDTKAEPPLKAQEYFNVLNRNMSKKEWKVAVMVTN